MAKWKFNWIENIIVAILLILLWLVIQSWDEIKHFIAQTFS